MEETHIEKAAETAHEVNRAYCNGLGDNTQSPWADAPKWQKDSARDGVRFLIRDPSAPASAQHESWRSAKKRDGWKFGPTKDPETREHPYMVPYDSLPASQKAKDALFQASVRGILAIWVVPAVSSDDVAKKVNLLEEQIDRLPKSRETSLAMTKLEECSMWIGKAIRNVPG